MTNKSNKPIKYKAVKITIITILSVMCSLVFIWRCFYGVFPFSKSHYVNISSEITTNDMPYWVNNDLVKIGDKLYYNYEPKHGIDYLFAYGVYEISSFGARRVYWGGPKITDGSKLFGLDTAENSLIRQYSDPSDDDQSYGQVYGYNTFLHKFDVINELSESTPAPMKDCRYVDGAYFYYLTNALYIQKEDKLEKITDVWQTNNEYRPVTFKYFIKSSDQVYYIKPDGKRPDEGESILCSYSVSQKKETEIKKIELPAENIWELFIDGDKVILGVVPEHIMEDDPLYMTSIDKDGELIKILDDHSPFGNTIVHNGTVYFIDFMSDIEGLYSVDLNNPGKRNMLYEGRVMSVHIFDSEWIYFTDDEEVLYRITHDGKTLEKVFG